MQTMLLKLNESNEKYIQDTLAKLIASVAVTKCAYCYVEFDFTEPRVEGECIYHPGDLEYSSTKSER
jgi:hypothetical protein